MVRYNRKQNSTRRKLYLVVFMLFVIFLMTNMTVDNQFLGTSNKSSALTGPVMKAEPSTDGTSWLAGWFYRQKCTVTGGTGAGTNYPVTMTVYNSTGTSSGSSCYIGTDANRGLGDAGSVNFGDVRFTDNDGGTQLDYWIELGSMTTTQAVFWIEVKDSLETTANIYIYYGKTSTASTSNGDNTFLFYDDFEDNDLTEWNQVDTGWSVQGTTKLHGSYAAYVNSDTTNRYLGHFPASNYTTDVMVHSYQRFQSTATTQYSLAGRQDNDYILYPLLSPAGSADWDMYNGSNRVWEADTLIVNAWDELEIAFDITNSRYRFWLNGTAKTAVMELDAHDGTAITYVWKLWIISANAADRDIWMDDFYVRKWMYTEPSITAWFTYEYGGPQTISAECTDIQVGDYCFATGVYSFEVVATNYIDDWQNLHLVWLYCKKLETSTTYWDVFYNQDTAAFTLNSGGSYVTLLFDSSTANGVGATLTVVFSMKIKWAMPDVSDADLVTYTEDDAALYTQTNYAVDYNYETRLDYYSTTLTDGSGSIARGNYNTIGGITAGCTIEFYGSPDHIYPADNETDFYVSCADVAGSPWSDTASASGVFSVAVDSDDAVGSDTYTFKVVQDGAGSAGTDEYYTTSLTKGYIADRIQVQSYTTNSTDNRDDIVDSFNITALLYYDYDDTPVADGTIKLNANTATECTPLNQGYWYFIDLHAGDAVGDATYDTVTCDGDDTNGITEVDQNSQDQTVIWDQIQVVSYSTNSTDNRDDIFDSFNVTVHLHYQYDGGHVINGTVALDGNDATECTPADSGNWYYIKVGNATAFGDFTFDVVTYIADGWPGITSVNQNSKSQKVIWDQIVVVSYSTNSTDNRDDVIDSFNVTVYLYYDYDDSPVINGTVTINGDEATECIPVDQGYWYYTNMTDATVRDMTYDTVAYTPDGWPDVDSVNQNGQSVKVIWDRIIVISYATNSTDLRDDVWDTINVTVHLHYEYDNAPVINGSIVINSDSATECTPADEGNWYMLYPGDGSVLLVQFNTIEYTADGSWGVSTVNQNSQESDEIVFDQIVVDPGVFVNSTLFVGSYRDNVGDTFNLTVYLLYDYDNTPVINGTVVINGHAASETIEDYGYWYVLDTSSSVGDMTFDTVVYTPDGSWGIYTVNQNGLSKLFIWDRILVVSYSTNSTDNRDDVIDSFNITVHLHYEYDDSTSFATITINGFATTEGLPMAGGYFYCVDLHIGDAVGDYTFNTVACAGDDTYGITVVNQNSQSVIVIWDRIQVQSYVTNSTDYRDSIGDTYNVTVLLYYDYDNTPVINGTVTMNGNTAAGECPADSGYWYLLHSHATVGDETFNSVTYVADGSWGMTTVDNTVVSGLMIWDQIEVMSYVTNSTGGDDRDNTFDSFNVTVHLHYDYDGATVINGTVTINGNAATECTPAGQGYWYWTDLHASNAVGDETYNTVAYTPDGSWGITVVNNTVTKTVVWDYVHFIWTVNATWTVINLYYINLDFEAHQEYDSVAFSGTFTASNSIMTSGASGEEILTKTTAASYDFVTLTCLDGVYSITDFVSNTVSCVFDNITCTVYYYVTPLPGSTTRLLNIFFENLTWIVNGSYVSINWDFTHHMNNSVYVRVDCGGVGWMVPPTETMPVSGSSMGVHYDCMAYDTVGGYYNFTIYSIDISTMEEMNIQVEDVNTSPASSIIISGSTNVDFDWSIYNEDVASGETGTVASANDFKIEFDKVTTYGLHNYSIYFDAGGSGNRWFNGSYYNAFTIEMEIPEEKGYFIEVKGRSNVDCTWQVYNRDTSAWTDESGSITGGDDYFQFLFFKLTTSGLHNYSLYFNITESVYIVKNGSYYVGSAFDWCTIRTFNSQGIHVDEDNFKIYIDGERIYENKFYNATDGTYTIRIDNVFNETIRTLTSQPWAREINVILTIYILKIYNQIADEFIYYTLTSTGGASYSQYIGPMESVYYYLYSGGTYTYVFDQAGGINGGHKTGSITMTADYGLIIESWDNIDIFKAADANRGASVSVEDMAKAMSIVQGSALYDIQMYTWIIIALLVGGLFIVPYIRGRGQEGAEEAPPEVPGLRALGEIMGGEEEEPVRRARVQPKQLAKHSFKQGPRNPNYRGGSSLKKEMGKSMWDKLKRRKRHL